MRDFTYANSLRVRYSSSFLILTTLFAIFLTIAIPVGASASELVRDERRLWANGNLQEVWTYSGSIAPENLVRKEWFHENGDKRRREQYKAGQQHGKTEAWYEEGTKELEETWLVGGRHGLVRQWPNPRNNKDRRKTLKPNLEANWEDGVPSGLWREWKGWGEDRFLHIEKTFVGGELEGYETVWREADGMDRKHSYAKGKLDGRQLAWDYGGQMMYQYHFIDGTPDGPQRKYEQDKIIQELVFSEGKLNGKMVWQSWDQDMGSDWKDGLHTDTTTREDGTKKHVRRWSFVQKDQFDSNGYLQFYGEKERFDDMFYDKLGRPERLEVAGPPKSFTNYWPDGQVRRAGGGRSSSPQGQVQEFYEDGSLHRVESYEKGQRYGTWKVYDRQGRVVSNQEWDYNLQSHVVTVWHNDDVKASEGPVQHGQGNLSGRKMGEWNYWTPNGRLLRTESYGPGAYSGNRALIKQMTEWDNEGRPVFEGSEKELVLFEYDEQDSDLVRRRRTVKLLDRSRHSRDRWDAQALKIVRTEVEKKKVLHADAQVIEVLGGRSVVLLDEHFRPDGTRARVERYASNGARDAIQEGWYADGSKAYAFKYVRGRLVSAEEWWPNGVVRLVAEFVTYNSAGENQVRSLAIRNEKGKAWRLDERGQPWKGPEKLFEKCLLWRFDPATPKP